MVNHCQGTCPWDSVTSGPQSFLGVTLLLLAPNSRRIWQATTHLKEETEAPGDAGAVGTHRSLVPMSPRGSPGSQHPVLGDRRLGTGSHPSQEHCQSPGGELTARGHSRPRDSHTTTQAHNHPNTPPRTATHPLQLHSHSRTALCTTADPHTASSVHTQSCTLASAPPLHNRTPTQPHACTHAAPRTPVHPS